MRTVCVELSVDHCFGDYKMLKVKHLLFLSCLFFFFFEPVRQTTKTNKTRLIPVSAAIP